MEDVLFTVKETAELLKTNINYVYDLINKGYLPALKIGRFKIRKTSILKFLEIYEGQDITDLNNIKKLEVMKNDERN